MMINQPQRLVLTLNSPKETKDLGRRLGLLLKGGEVIALRGELGAGKTTLVQGLAWGLDVGPEEPITSPSFILVATSLSGRLELNHVDLYRLNSGQAAELGLEEISAGPGVTAVEWADRAEEELPSDRLDINLVWLGPERRRVEMVGLGPGAKSVVEALARSLATACKEFGSWP